ncbi:hypothetical protein ACWCW7_17720 [Nocardia tengchongensis]
MSILSPQIRAHDSSRAARWRPRGSGTAPPVRRLGHTVYAAFARCWVGGDAAAIHTDLRDACRRAASRKIHGRKRHVIVDCLGLFLVVVVTGTNT